jgi:hypothetical protein
LHLSLKDFLTNSAQPSPASHKFLNEKGHSQRLGLQCLIVMNDDLKERGPAIGYLANSLKLTGVPDFVKSAVSKEPLYACSFWIDHVVEVEVSEENLIVALCNFLSNYVVPWVEAVSHKGRFQTLSKMR